MSTAAQDLSHPATERRHARPTWKDRAARARSRGWLAPAVAVLALVLWWWGLGPLDPDQLDGFGIIRHVSPLVLLSYPVLLAAGVLELLRTRPRTGVLVVVTALGVLLVYGLQPATQQVARLPVAWLHAGFAAQIADYGEIIHNYDTRFSWPGFFAGAAFLGRAAGLDSVVPLLAWTPVALAGAATLAMRALAAAALSNDRAAWLATWVFLLANWTEQDYFSPQGVAMVLLLAALAVTVRYLVHPSLVEGGRVLPWRRTPAATGSSARQRIGAQLVVVALATVLAPTHQLTPYTLAMMLGVMLLFGRLSSAWLPVMAAVPALTWFALGGKEFWVGQLELVTGSIGDVNSSVDQGLGSRLVGDVGHLTMVGLRIGITLAVALAAVIGLLVLRRRGTRTLALPALAASPFLIAVVQPYGGEVFVRCYLFALPWFAIGAGIALERLLRVERSGSGGRVLTVVALAGLGMATVAVRGGNDAFLAFTRADVAAVSYINDNAANGSRFTTLGPYAPVRFARIRDLVLVNVGDYARRGEDCDAIDDTRQCIVRARVDYLMINPQQDLGGVILDGRPAGWTEQIRRELVDRADYRVVFSSGGRVVLASPEARRR